MIDENRAHELTPELDSKELALLCAKSALDKKSENLKIYEVSEISSYADYLILMDANSERQVSAIADHLARTIKEKFRIHPIGVEGLDASQWVLIDFGSVIIHIFQPHIRSMYDLDLLWHQASRLEIPSDYYSHLPANDLSSEF